MAATAAVTGGLAAEREFVASFARELGRHPRVRPADWHPTAIVVPPAPRTSTGTSALRGAFVAHGEDGHWTMQIRTLQRDVAYTVHVRAADTVAALKRLLSPVAGIAVDDQRLVCAGRAMMDGQRLRDFEAAALEALIFLVKRPRLAAPDDAGDASGVPLAGAAPASGPPPPSAMDTSEDDAAFWASASAYFARRVSAAAAERFTQHMRQAFNALQRDHPHAS